MTGARGRVVGMAAALAALGCVLALPSPAQTTSALERLGALSGTDHATGRADSSDRDTSAPKLAVAMPVADGDIRVDGSLDDPAWRGAAFLSDLVQKDPTQGAPPTVPTEIAFLFDDGALYVGARMYADSPADIAAIMTRRDEIGNVETLVISLDTYFDRRTAYSFAVTAAGVRLDWYNATDEEEARDFTYNPVWEARARIDSVGWTAEMRIPFSQLRFNDRDEHVFGANVNRWIPTRREDLYWVYVPRDETGWSSRFGRLTGVSGIESTSRVELMPYVATDTRFTSSELVDADDPFAARAEFEGRLGADFKMGLGPNLTLDATVNPDFGQVEADPAVVNLSAFEVFFQERRPFFIEGAQLLRGPNQMTPTYYYSRRIGAAPHGSASGDYADAPDATTILGAAKLTGRTSSGLSIGALGAVTQAEHARTYDGAAGVYGREPVEPLAGWGVVRLQQEIGRSASTVGLTATGVARDLGGDNPLRQSLSRHALTGGGDFLLRLDEGTYQISGHFGLSYVDGDPAAIEEVQRSSAHYFQRPDQDHVSLDPTRTSLFGLSGSLQVRKAAGEHWLWNAGLWGDNPNWELNDLGQLGRADDIAGWARLTYRETTPGTTFRSYRINAGTEAGWNFGGIRKRNQFNLSGDAEFANYWRAGLETTYAPGALDDRLTRGGPLMGRPPWGSVGAYAGNSITAKSRWVAEFMWGNLDRGDDWFVNLGFEFEPSDRLRLEVRPGFAYQVNERQYYTTLDRESDRTFGRRYVFSTVEQTELSVRLRANYAFTPDLSVELYAEPFTASGKFSDFGEVPEARSYELRRYGTDGTTIAERLETDEEGTTTRLYDVTDGGEAFTLEDLNFNTLSFRSNLVLRWELRPGSTLFVVWQRDLGTFKEGYGTGRSVGVGDLFESLGSAGRNILAVKLSYWIPM